MHKARYAVLGIVLAALMFASAATATAATLQAKQVGSTAGGNSVVRRQPPLESGGISASSLSAYYAGWMYLQSHANGGTYAYTRGDSVYVESYATDANNWGFYRMGTQIWDRATGSYIGGGWTSAYVYYSQTSYIYVATGGLEPSSGRYCVDVILWDDFYGVVEDVESFELTVLPDTYVISASAGPGGTISGPSTVSSGGSASYSITPNLGYHVENVFVDGYSVGAATGYTFNNASSNHTISATFAINTYTISSSAGPGGTINGPATVNWGGSASYSITPNLGYHVEDVFVDGNSVGAATGHTFSSVTSNHTISATFAINTYTISSSAGPGGTINGPATVNWGSSPWYSIIPSTGYRTTNVLVDGSSVGTVTSYTFGNVTSDRSIAAEFAQNASGVFTLTYVAGANGSISGQSQQLVSSGSDGRSVTAVPSPGHHFEGWSDGSISNPRTDVNVTSDLAVSAVFAVGRALTAVSPPSISPSRPRRGKIATFTAYMAPGVAAIAGGSRLDLYRLETRTVKTRVRGRIRRVRVKYWRLRNAVAMTTDASGRLAASAKLRLAGKWQAQVTYLGSPIYESCVSGARGFTVR